MCIHGMLRVGGGGGMRLSYLSLAANTGTWKKCFAYLFHKSTDTILFFKSFTYKSGDAKTKFLLFIILSKFTILKVVSVNVDS